VDQTCSIPKGPDQDYKKDAPTPQSSNTRGCQECGWQVCERTLSCNNATSIVTIPWHFDQTPGPTESYYNTDLQSKTTTDEISLLWLFRGC